MADDKLAELLKTQKSLTEWLEDINHKDVASLRVEDNEKRERLDVLNKIIGLPYDKPTKFKAAELNDQNPTFVAFLKEHGDELCALRLIPIVDDAPKIRMRGKSIRDTYAWFLEQDVDVSRYRADFVPHPPDYLWATIFVVNEHGIQGEIIAGGHHQLTQGFHQTGKPMVFRYDFKKWAIEPKNDKALAHLKEMVELIRVTDKQKQQKLKDELRSTFINDYIAGYFETASSSQGTLYIDYSSALGGLYSDLVVSTNHGKGGIVSGRAGSPGKVTGPVCIVDPDHIDAPFPEGSVLVCSVTTPSYVPLMQKAVAIVTDQGGILSHAAIVARELHKPCIVGTGDATQKLHNGETVTVNADKGTVSVAG